MEAQVQAQVFSLDRSSTEEQPYNRTVLPPNYVSLRQLRERRLKEEQEKKKETEKIRESDGRARLPQNHAPFWQLKERCLQEEKEIEVGRGREKDTDHERERERKREKTKGKGRDEESESRPLLPPNYVSLRLLREQRLKEQKDKENEKEKEEERVKRKMKGKAKEVEDEEEEEEEEEKGQNNSLLLPKYVSLRQLKELRLQERKEKGAEEEAQQARLQQVKTQEKGDESGEIEVKITEETSDRPRNLQFRKHDKCGCMQSSWLWQPVLPPADTSTDAGASSANSVFLPENAGQNIDSDMKPKSKSKTKMWKQKKNHSRKKTSGKNKAVKGSEGPMEVTGLKIGEALSASSASKEVITQENDTINKKGGNANLTMSSGQSIPVCLDIKGFNGAQLMGFKKHNRRGKEKEKFVNLSEQSHDVIPVRKVAKGSDGEEEVIVFRIKDGKDEKGKREMVNIPQSSGQTPSNEEEKGAPGVGEVIGSQIGSCQEKAGGKNVDLPDSSKFGDRVGGRLMMRNQAAGFRGMGQSKAGRFTARPAEHLKKEGSFMWVPKRSS